MDNIPLASYAVWIRLNPVATYRFERLAQNSRGIYRITMESNNNTIESADDESLSLLMTIGFKRDEALAALRSTNGNVEQAADSLLASRTLPPTGSATNSVLPIPSPIQGSISQYDLPDGRSACSCIALAAASAFLEAASTGGNSTPLSPNFLDSAVQKGHEIYQTWKNSTHTSSEHTSPEEVLPLFPQLQLEGAIRQGLLPHFEPTLQDCCCADTPWTALVLTKPPETILLLLSSSTAWVVDSHSRPPYTTAAWAQSYTSLSSLCPALQQLFPATHIPDVPDSMMLMYNSFDVYVVRRKARTTNTSGS